MRPNSSVQKAQNTYARVLGTAAMGGQQQEQMSQSQRHQKNPNEHPMLFSPKPVASDPSFFDENAKFAQKQLKTPQNQREIAQGADKMKRGGSQCTLFEKPGASSQHNQSMQSKKSKFSESVLNSKKKSTTTNTQQVRLAGVYRAGNPSAYGNQPKTVS